MPEPDDLLKRMRVASPCPADWGRMEGDARVRFCRQCDLHVYNLSELTKAEVLALFAGAEGRVCGRLYRRADGTVLTKDCPAGLRALRRRVARAAGAVFAALVSLASPAPSRGQDGGCPGGDWLKVERVGASTHAALSGVVRDPIGAVILGAKVSVKFPETGRDFKAITSGEGEFLFPALPAGKFTLEVSSPNFTHFRRPDLTAGTGEVLSACVTLDIATMGEIILLSEPPRPDVEARGAATVFRGRALDRLPF